MDQTTAGWLLSDSDTLLSCALSTRASSGAWRLVDHLLLFCLGSGPVSGAVPMIRKHILLGGDMDRFFVDCQPAQDRGLALRIAAGSLNKERGVKCSSHDGSY